MDTAASVPPTRQASGRTEHVVDALIGARLVDPSERAQSLAVVAAALDGGTHADAGARRRNLPQLVEVVAYLGGALVLAAGALFLFQQWGGLGFGWRVALLAVMTVVLLVAGAVSARVPDGSPGLRDEANDARRRLAGSLLTFAAVCAALLVGHLVEHVTTERATGVYWPTVAGALVGLVVGAIGYRVAPTALGMVATITAAVTATMSLIDGIKGNEGVAAGLALFLLGAAWLLLTEAGWFHESTIARSLGLLVVLVGAQVPVLAGEHNWLGYLLTLAVVVVGIALYLRRLSWPYLAAAVIAVTLVVPEAVAEWTEGSLGAVGGVLVAGITLLLASYAGYRIRAEATD